MKRGLAAFFLAALLFVGCDNPQKTADNLRREIAEFKAVPTPENQQKVEVSFTKLENQIAELDKRGDDVKVEGLKNQLVDLRADYQSAKMSKALKDAGKAIQGFGEAVKEGAKSIGDAFKGPATNN